MTSISPLRDKLVQLEHDTFDAACDAGKGYTEARVEATLAVKQYEEQALARLALYPALVKAAVDALALLDKQRAEYKSAVSILPRPAVTEGPIAHALRAVLAQAEAIEKEAQSG